MQPMRFDFDVITDPEPVRPAPKPLPRPSAGVKAPPPAEPSGDTGK
jgi:hypothetical protein